MNDNDDIVERVKRHLLGKHVWGDGVHDDTVGVQWHADNVTPLPEGTYLITSTIHIKRGGRLTASNSIFRAAHAVSPMIRVDADAGGSNIFYCEFVE